MNSPTPEVEIERIVLLRSALGGKKFMRPSSQPIKNWAWWCMSAILGINKQEGYGPGQPRHQ
jgi:hypothetical protein